MSPMDFNAELARFTSDSTLPDWVQEAVKGIVNEAQKSARSNSELNAANTELRAANIKIQPELRYDYTSYKNGLDGDKGRFIAGLGVSYLF